MESARRTLPHCRQHLFGASDIAIFLITSPQGHILLDGGFQETAPQVEANIRKLGFKLEDVKYILNSQAHFDHAPPVLPNLSD